MDKCTVTLDKVQTQIKKLNISKASGPDNIHAKVISELKDCLDYPLYLLYDLSLQEGKIPSQWKIANVKPLFKKGNQHIVSNYRPVSLTAVCGKILERIIRDEIVEFLESHNILSNSQHGFRTGRSCCTQLLELLEIWTDLVDKNINWDCIYLDFAKAFDKVPHKRLITKVEAIGIHGKLLSWISDFIFQRQQQVGIGDCTSAKAEVTSGIPQGSVLGPILFIIYINDLPNELQSHVKIFADDTKVFHIIQSLQDHKHLQEDIIRLVEWANKWQLTFNIEKCKVLHYGKNNPCLKYVMSNTELSESDLEKDLGVHFDPSLKFSSHVGKITTKANQRLAIIKRTFTNMTPEMFLPLYKTLVRPILEYCSSVWNPLLKKDKVEIEKVQRRATKIIHEFKDLEYSERLFRLKLDSLNFRRRRADLIQVFKILKNKENVDKEVFFTLHMDDRTRGNQMKLFKKQSHSNIRLNSFSQRVVNDWNNLSNEVVLCDSVNGFKTALKIEWASHPERYDMP